MVLLKASLPILGLAAYAQAAPAVSGPNSSLNSTGSSIKWTECSSELNKNAILPVECAQLNVPRDYTDDKSNKTVALNLIRVPATKQPFLGSILMNYGGPGEGAVTATAESGLILNMMSGGQFDIVAFDPRGTTTTLPFQCFTSNLEAQEALNALGRIPPPEDHENLGYLWAAADNFAQACAKTQNETGALINTPFAARDVVSVATALGEKDKIRYWGLSYGTTLGATLISMFPEKIEGAILDGVQNPHEYMHGEAEYEGWVQSDQVFAGIFEHCLKNADNCALSRRGKSAAELEKLYWSLYEKLRYNPIPFPDGGGILNSHLLNALTNKALYDSMIWPVFTTGIDMLLGSEEDYDQGFMKKWLGLSEDDQDTQDQDTQDQDTQCQDTQGQDTQGLQVPHGIRCSDYMGRLSSLEEYMPIQERLYNISRILGPISASPGMTCSRWKIEPKERYEGNFQVAPRKPVLIVGNTYDGATPIVSARNVSSGFKGSTVLELNAYGHCTIGIPSKCIVQRFTEYWVNGTMPEPGTVCEADYQPWSNVTWATVMREIGYQLPGNSSNVSRRSLVPLRFRPIR
ncbi:TAP domain-containing protein [Beauveria brongniartii RCEF 3172]|uniref:TAP domain-containing protein n=1 Tax=Beauveria brongniartii RCEF 3172 TaxID=1081107 RepID=A0A167H106_9HYPO|nr:TAP domain-containing protein [Beauveria brongniartii RCEF 3172]